jgi:hypothetical protein
MRIGLTRRTDQRGIRTGLAEASQPASSAIPRCGETEAPEHSTTYQLGGIHKAHSHPGGLIPEIEFLTMEETAREQVERIANLADLTTAQVVDLLTSGLHPEVSKAWKEDLFTGERVYQVAWRKPEDPLWDGRWQVLMCDCSRRIGVSRCDFCGTMPTHPVQMRLA